MNSSVSKFFCNNTRINIRLRLVSCPRSLRHSKMSSTTIFLPSRYDLRTVMSRNQDVEFIHSCFEWPW